MSSDRFDVVVVGAGVAGLVAAVETAKGGARTLVLDARAGWSGPPTGAWLPVQRGPHALYEQGAFMAVLKRWGLEPPGRQPLATDAYALLGDDLHPFPAGPGRLARTPLLRPASRLRFGRLMTRLPRLGAARSPAGRSPTGSTTRICRTTCVRSFSPSCASTYGAAPDLLDAGAAVLQLRAGLQGVRYLDGGWQRVVDGLVRALADAGGILHAGTAVGAVEADGGRRASAAYGPVEAAAVILAGLPPAEAARLLGRDAATFEGPRPSRRRCLELGTDPASPGPGRVRRRSASLPVRARRWPAPRPAGPRDGGGDALPPTGARTGRGRRSG